MERLNVNQNTRGLSNLTIDHRARYTDCSRTRASLREITRRVHKAFIF